MAFEPQPFVAVNSGDAQDAPEGAKPISLYGIEAGGEAAPVTWASVTGKPSTFAPATHTHAADDIDSGTLAVARIPSLAITKITGLQAKITELEGRLDALEAAAV